MRIVIDMQGAQTESRFRGIGRYTMAFAQAVVRNRGNHEIFLALSGLFPHTIEPIRAAFEGLLPQENIRVWDAPGQVREVDAGNDVRREKAELLREAFIASLQPDVIHISSLFEGYVDDAVTSIGRFDTVTPVSVILYDLIPLLNADFYLKNNPSYERHYQQKIEWLRKASAFLAISEFSRREGVEALPGLSGEFVSISTAIDSHFKPRARTSTVPNALQRKINILRPFLLYTGGADERKNLPRLIQAYATLPENLRQRHQLILAGRILEGQIVSLKHLAEECGFRNDELVFAGFVTEEELTELYNHCQLFVFPSWHEGFGLPALEAMACGAPVIGSNTSSLPEVIGFSEALFDPFAVESIAQKMQKVLEDHTFRERLIAHGLEHAKKFSWDLTAARAIDAWEAMPKRVESSYLEGSIREERLLSELADRSETFDDSLMIEVASCIAQNQGAALERQLFVDVSELCQRDSATGVQRVVRSYLKCLLESPPAGFRVEPVYATIEQGYRYARRFTQRFLGELSNATEDAPIRWQRGDLFFGLDMQHHVQLAHKDLYQQMRQAGVIVKFLVYDLLPIELDQFFRHSEVSRLHAELMGMFAAMDGIICISRATSEAYASWSNEHNLTIPPCFQNTWVHIGADIEGSQPSKGLPADANEVLQKIRTRPSYLVVSTLEPRKRQGQILDAAEILWKQEQDINIILVGQLGWKTEKLAARIEGHVEFGKRLFWLEGISDDYLELVYEAATCLIAASLNEGFGLSLIEGARHGLPIIARDIPVFREVAGNGAYYFKGDKGSDLAHAMLTWQELYLKQAHPDSQKIQWASWQASAESLKEALVSDCYVRKQLLVDISELVQRDAKSGIQRVVRSILLEWLQRQSYEYKIEPIYASHTDGYRYARKFTSKFLKKDDSMVADELIDFAPGDIFLGLDLAPAVVPAHSSFYTQMRRQGIRIAFVVYDLLPLMDAYFEKGHADSCVKWLDIATSGDVAICISESVAGELQAWMGQNKPQKLSDITIKSFHLGADVDNSNPTCGLPENARQILDLICAKPSFLQVSTLAPHKGHAQVLDAFELLWKGGHDINLVFVGNEGWLVDKLIERLRSHPELNHRLLWLEGISDEYLAKVYAYSSCLVAASYGEGFGLPLIEAAQHKLPIIARDIPVFREVGREHAYYFAASEAWELAEEIKSWLKLYGEDKHPKSEGMPWLTWKQSASELLRVLGIHPNQPEILSSNRC